MSPTAVCACLCVCLRVCVHECAYLHISCLRAHTHLSQRVTMRAESCRTPVKEIGRASVCVSVSTKRESGEGDPGRKNG